MGGATCACPTATRANEIVKNILREIYRLTHEKVLLKPQDPKNQFIL